MAHVPRVGLLASGRKIHMISRESEENLYFYILRKCLVPENEQDSSPRNFPRHGGELLSIWQRAKVPVDRSMLGSRAKCLKIRKMK
jgi:hypothetical protein